MRICCKTRSGTSKTLMVRNLSPLAAHLIEALMSLRFATKHDDDDSEEGAGADWEIVIDRDKDKE
ncbi:hypothetical protein FB451DRAFT_1413337 [Mycena latifolia]|nr:hypothetical protein FB451DRAFT_1413337 [Mycena latifolia]